MKDYDKKISKEKNQQKRVDKYLEKGEELRLKEAFGEAIEAYAAAVTASEGTGFSLDRVIAARAICECAALDSSDDDNSLTTRYLKQYEHAVNNLPEKEKYGEMQLKHHVSAWCLLKSYERGVASDASLRDAVEACELSLHVLEQFGDMIEANKKCVDRCGDVAVRRAKVYILRTEIAECVKDAGARKFAELALKAIRGEDGAEVKSVRYQIYRASFRLASSSSERNKAASELTRLAEGMKSIDNAAECRCEASLCTIKCLIFDGKWDEARRMLLPLLLSHKGMGADDVADMEKTTALVDHISSLVDEAQCAHSDVKRERFEEAADVLAGEEYFEQAIHFYEKALAECSTNAQRCPLLSSLAETARDLGRFDVALSYYQKEHSLHRRGQGTGKREDELVAEDSCFILACMVDAEPVYELLDKLTILLARAPDDKRVESDSVLLGAMVKRLRHEGDSRLEQYEKQWQHAEAVYTALRRSQPVDEEEEEEGCPATWCLPTTIAGVVRRWKVEGKHYQSDEKLRADKDRPINQHGETHLHVAAKEGNEERVRRLLQLGYNVNAKDYGGWTPLHEATESKLDIVRLLLKANADPNMPSDQCLEGDGDDDMENVKNITPLMDACHRGNAPLARLLIAFKALVTLADSGGWTAADYCWNYLQVTGESGESDSPSDESEMRQLLAEIEAKQRTAGYRPRGCPPPPRKRKRAPVFVGRPRRSRVEDEGRENLTEYEAEMRRLNNGNKRNKKAAVMIDSDEFDSDKEEYNVIPEDYGDNIEVATKDRRKSLDDAIKASLLRRRNSGGSAGLFDRSPSVMSAASSGSSKRRRSDGGHVVDESPKSSFFKTSSAKRSRPAQPPMTSTQMTGAPVFDVDDDDLDSVSTASERRRRSGGVQSRSTPSDSGSSGVRQRPAPSPAQMPRGESIVTVVYMDNASGKELTSLERKLRKFPSALRMDQLCAQLGRDAGGVVRAVKTRKDKRFKEAGAEISLSDLDLKKAECVYAFVESRGAFDTYSMLLDSSSQFGSAQIEALKKLDAEKVLEFHGVPFERDAFEAALNAIKVPIKKLVLNGYGVSDSWMIDVCLAKTADRLTHLSLSNCAIDDARLEKITVIPLVRVTEVSLAGNPITSGAALEKCIKRWPALISLDLSKLEQLTDAQRVVERLMSDTGAWRSLQRVSLAHSPWLSTTLLKRLVAPRGKDQPLRELDLSACGLLDAWDIRLDAFPHLTRLLLSDCPLAEFNHLIDFIVDISHEKNLEYVDVSNTRFGPKELSSLLDERMDGRWLLVNMSRKGDGAGAAAAISKHMEEGDAWSKCCVKIRVSRKLGRELRAVSACADAYLDQE